MSILTERRKRILVVEDEAPILNGIKDTLELEDYEVITATDGQEGMRLALSVDSDVVLLDVMMPRMSGLELVAALRADPSTRAIPLLLLSAKAQTDDVQAGLAAGADGYVTKPFEPLDLIERVNALLAR